VSLIKRQMGSDFDLVFHDVRHTPESVSALILRALVNTDEPVRAVITVPAYFGIREREATAQAARLAGIDVLELLSEPVAAALYYGTAELTAGGGTVLVYDLGGGTFDTTVITVSAGEIVVVCTDGDDHLGGADWDERLRDFLLEKFTQEVPPGTDVEDDTEFLQALNATAEMTKQQLSRTEARPVALRGAGAAARIEVTRAQFEELTKDLLDKTIDIVRRTLATLAAKQPGTRIDEVLLVGGSTKMPAVAQRLRAEFGWEPKLHDPDLAVAKGAALYALGQAVYRQAAEADPAAGPEQIQGRLAEAAAEMADQTGIPAEQLMRISGKQVSNVLPKAFGVKLVDASLPDYQTNPHYYVEHMVYANDNLPTGQKSLRVGTLVDNQKSVEIELYEQSGTVAGRDMAENRALTDARDSIDGLPPMPAGSPVDIVMKVDAEGLLELEATEPTTGKSLQINVRVSVMSAEQVEQAKDVVSGLTVTG
jgi:molecular chaperone DnaK